MPETTQLFPRRKNALERKVSAELQEMGVEDLDAFHNSAEERLEEIRDKVHAIVLLGPRLDVEEQRKNPESFQDATREAERSLAELNILRALFKAQVEIQYPYTPILQKFVIFLLSVFGGRVREATVIQTFGGNRRKRTILLEACEELCSIADEALSKIEEALRAIEELRNLPIHNRQQEILEADPEYNEIVNKIDRFTKLLENAENNWEIMAADKHQAEINDLERKKNRKEEAALQKAQYEFMRNGRP